MSEDSTGRQNIQQARRIAVELEGDIAVLIPDGDLGEFAVSQISEETGTALTELKERSDWRHLIIDFQKTDYFGSSALGLFIRLWKRVQQQGGRMAVCHLSEHERDLLKITRLAEFWSVADSREQAIAAVRGE